MNQNILNINKETTKNKKSHYMYLGDVMWININERCFCTRLKKIKNTCILLFSTTILVKYVANFAKYP